MFSLLTFVTLGATLVVAGLVVALVIALAARKPGSNIVVVPGALHRLIGIAMTGNVDALLAATVDSFHLHLADGSLPEKLVEAGLAEIERNLKDPSGKTPIIDIVAHITGKPRQQVFELFRAELGEASTTAPASPPAAPAAVSAALLLFFLPSLAYSASPVSTWGMPVKGPQRFYETGHALRSDPPLMRDASGQLVQYQPQSFQVSAVSRPMIEPPNGRHYQAAPVYQSNAGFWQRTCARRFVSAPFRWRPLRRLFGRC